MHAFASKKRPGRTGFSIGSPRQKQTGAPRWRFTGARRQLMNQFNASLFQGSSTRFIGQRLIVFCLAILFAIGPFHGARAEGQDVFTVKGIGVDVTDKDAATAKIKAITEAQVKAFHTLLQRIASPEAASRLKGLSARDIGRMMSSLSVEEERTGPNRYIGRLTIRFSPRKVRALLRNKGVGYITERAPRILIIPVWQGPDGPVLWADNPWLEAWRNLHAEDALVPIIIPAGDDTDRQTLSAQDALAGDAGRLQALKLRYDTEGVLVAVAGPKGDNAVRAVMTGPSPVGTIAFDKTYIAPEGGIAEAARMAAQRFHEVMTYKWKKKVMAKRAARAHTQAAATRLKVIVPFNSLREWQAIRARLASTPGVASVDVSALSGTHAEVTVTSSLSAAQLQDALRASRLSLRNSGGRWYLQAY